MPSLFEGLSIDGNRRNTASDIRRRRRSLETHDERHRTFEHRSARAEAHYRRTCRAPQTARIPQGTGARHGGGAAFWPCPEPGSTRQVDRGCLPGSAQPERAQPHLRGRSRERPVRARARSRLLDLIRRSPGTRHLPAGWLQGGTSARRGLGREASGGAGAAPRTEWDLGSPGGRWGCRRR